MTHTASVQNRWLFGPVPDLLLGCGLAYAFMFVVLSLAGPQLRAVYPYGLLPLLALIFSVPHYGATLLRVYERPEDRKKYEFFSVHLSALVAIVFVIGVYDNFVGSLMITLYLTWSPWHYTGQNYGISLMFLGRRGIRISAFTKRLIYLSFMTSFLLTILELHSISTADVRLIELDDNTYRLYPLGISDRVHDIAVVILGACYLVFTISAARQLLRVASFNAVLPTFTLMASQALWFLVPMYAQYYGMFQDVDSVSRSQQHYAFFWVAFGHSIQYLWITSYFAKKEKRADKTSMFLGKCLLWGAAIWVVPAMVFSPGALGRLPYDAGLAALVAAAVNIHHFILDGAIWKLRDGRIARVLLKNVESTDGKVAVGGLRSIARAGIVLAGLLSVAVLYTGTTEYELKYRRALRDGDIAQAERSAKRLSWLGRDSAETRSELALLKAVNGDLHNALDTGRSAVALHETMSTWNALGIVYERAGQLENAIDATWRAVRVTLPSEALINRLGSLLARGLAQGGSTRAAALTVTDLMVDHFDEIEPRALRLGAIIYDRAGMAEQSVRTARRGIELAESRGDSVLADNLRSILKAFSGRSPG